MQPLPFSRPIDPPSTFGGRDSVLMRDFLAGVDSLPFASLEMLAGPSGVVILAPHPDDESIGCGGLIAASQALGRRVEVVVATDGCGSHPHSPTYPPERLSAVRRDEVAGAVQILGVHAASLTFLDLKDGAAPKSGLMFDAAVEQIGTVVDRIEASALFVTWSHDPHCDHEAAAAMAAAVARTRPGLRIWHYPIWGLHRMPGEPIDASPRGVRFDIAPWLALKRRAIAAHASQLGTLIKDDPDGFALTDAVLAPFLGTFERFLEPDL